MTTTTRNAHPTLEYLHEALHYNSLLGHLVWKISRRGIRQGSIAGAHTTKGHIVIGIDHRIYPAHYVAWALYYGEWPVGRMIHRDGCRHNNIITNLELRPLVPRATTAPTLAEARARQVLLPAARKAMMRKLCWMPDRQQWRGEVHIEGHYRTVGYWGDKATAVEACMQVELFLHGAVLASAEIKRPPSNVLKAMKQALKYDPNMGLFYWKIAEGSWAPGDVAGGGGNGYRSIKLCDADYRLHQVAWFFHYGEWPTQHIRHLNGDKRDNRISNLFAEGSAAGCYKRESPSGD